VTRPSATCKRSSSNYSPSLPSPSPLNSHLFPTRQAEGEYSHSISARDQELRVAKDNLNALQSEIARREEQIAALRMDVSSFAENERRLKDAIEQLNAQWEAKHADSER
jgi:septal ring factor EnvC (AmiA/AmiB activator)